MSNIPDQPTFKPNAKNLYAVLTHIEAHPETWKQCEWHCGTTHCFFGHAQMMAGKKEDIATVTRDGRMFLGLTMYEAAWLSNAFNTLKDLHDIVAEIVKCDGNRYGSVKPTYGCDGYDIDGLDCNNAPREAV